MKKITLKYSWLLLLTLWSVGAMAQTYELKGHTTSVGGGTSTGGNFENFAIAGEPVIGPFTGGVFSGIAGMLSLQTPPPADFYWIGDGGDYRDITHWSSSSGGPADKSRIPGLGDNVFFDANSFTIPGQVVSISDLGDAEGAYFNSMDWTGVTNDPTFQIKKVSSPWLTSHTNGSLIFDANMTLDFLGAEFEFSGDGSYVIDTKGHFMGTGSWLAVNYTRGLPGTGNGTGTADIVSDLNCDFVYMAGGVFNSNNFPITSPEYFWIAGNNNKTVTLGTSEIHTNQLIASNQLGKATITGDYTFFVNGSMNGGGLSFNIVQIEPGTTTVRQSNTYNVLRLMPGSETSFQEGTTHTFNELDAMGTQGSPITIKSDVDGVQANFYKAAGIVETEWLILKDNNASGAIFNANNSSDMGNVTGWNIFDACQPPVGLVQGVFTTTSMDVSWMPQTLAVKYDIQYRVDGTTVWTTVQDIAVTNASITGLVQGIPYDIRVRNVCAADRSMLSDWSSVETFSTGGASSCELPTGISATATDASLDLSWTAAGGAMSYEVRYRVDNTAQWNNLPTPSNNLLISGLVSGTMYDIRVRTLCSVDGSLQSPYTATVNFTTTGAVSCDVPSSIAVSGITDTGAQVSWTGQPGASYTLNYKVKGSTGWTVLDIGVDIETASLTGLASGMTYVYKVKTICAVDGSLASAFTTNQEFITTGTPACDIPAGLSATLIGDNTATINWTMSTGAVVYDFWYRLDGTAAWTQLLAGTEEASLAGLFAGMPYEVKVRSVCAADGSVKSAWSAKLIFATTGASACAMPSNVGVALDPLAIDEASIDWDDVGSPDYEVRLRIKGSTAWNYYPVSLPVLNLAGLEPGLTYQFAVRSVCDPGIPLQSDYTATATFTTFGVAACIAPVNISASNITDAGATIGWDDAGADHYVLKYRVFQAAGWTTMTVVGLTADLTGLIAGTDYQVSVRSVCDAGGTIVSDYSPNSVFSTTGTPVCETPTGITASSIASAGATIDWNDAGGALNYKIRYKVYSGTGWNFLNAGASTTNLSGLYSGTQYRVQIRTICTPDNTLLSGWSTALLFTTSGSPACEVPVNLLALNQGENTSDVSWGAVTGAVSYEIRFRETGTTVWVIQNSVSNTANLSGLQAGTDYQWKVRTICSTDNSLRSAFSTRESFTTLSVGTGARSSGIASSGATESGVSAMNLRVFPNPVDDFATVNFVLDDEAKVAISVFSINGVFIQQVVDKRLGPGNYTYDIDANTWSKGVYMLKVNTSKGVMVEKIVKNR